MKRARLIYNPVSGGGKILNALDTIFDVYQAHGYHVDVFRISPECDENMSICDAELYDHFIVSGGDGTINRFVNLLKLHSIAIPLAILPTGTANDFAKLFDFPSDFGVACEKILDSTPKAIDLGRVGDTYFINVFSTGIFSNVSQTTDRGMIKAVGKIAYVLNGVKEVAKSKVLKLHVESTECTELFDAIALFVFNGKSAGNFPLAYRSDIDDGFLDVLVIKKNFAFEIPELATAFTLHQHLDKSFKSIAYFRTKKLRVSADQPCLTDVDGESGPDLPIEIECAPGGLTLLGIKEKSEEQRVAREV